MTSRVRRPWRWLLAAALIAAASYGLYRYRFAAPDRPDFITVPVTRADIEDVVLANGTLQAYRMVNVGAQVSGQVKALKVRLGERVEEGQLVAEIDSLPQQNQLRNSEAALTTAQAELRSAEALLAQNRQARERQRRMRAADASSQSDLETAEAAYKTSLANVDALKAKVAQARIAVDTAQVNLRYTRIVTPIAGTVVSLVTEEGTTVNANQMAPTIIIVAQTDTMTVKASISEADVTTVRPGQPVYFTILGDPQRRYETALRTIEPATDTIKTSSSSGSSASSGGSSGSSSSSSATGATAIYYNGLLDVPNPDGKLRISMTATVSIVRAAARGVLTIPAEALGARGADGRHPVQVAGADGRTQIRRVSTGVRNNLRVQITEGLQEGDRVVASSASAGPPSTGPQRRGPPMRL